MSFNRLRHLGGEGGFNSGKFGRGDETPFSIAHSFSLDGISKVFRNSANLIDINNVVSGTDHCFTFNIGCRFDTTGLLEYLFSSQGLNVSIRKTTGNIIQAILRDSAFKSATSTTPLNTVDWYFITITYNGLLTLGNRVNIYINAVDDTASDNTTNTIDAGVDNYQICGKDLGADRLDGNFYYLSLLDICLTPAQITSLHNVGKPLNSQTEYGVNCKLFLTGDTSNDIEPFTLSDTTNSIDFEGVGFITADKTTDTPYYSNNDYKDNKQYSA